MFRRKIFRKGNFQIGADAEKRRIFGFVVLAGTTAA